MSLKVIIRPLAEKDTSEAATWYEEQQPGLGEQFLDAIRGALRRIQEHPEACSVVYERHRVRRILTQRFPYRIFFTLHGDRIIVHAIVHAKRHDRHWKSRV